MLNREDIQNIFNMYIDSVSIDEINNIYQKKLDEFCKELELGMDFMTPFDAQFILSNIKVVHKYIVTQECFDFVQILMKENENH